MIACLIGKLRVDMHHIVIKESKKQAVAQQNVIQTLRVAFKDICISLALRQRLNQGMQDAAFEGVQRVGKLEVVQVTQDDNLCARVQGQDAIDEIIDDLGLLSALGLGAECRRLEAAEERLISALGVKVIGD